MAAAEAEAEALRGERQHKRRAAVALAPIEHNYAVVAQANAQCEHRRRHVVRGGPATRHNDVV